MRAHLQSSKRSTSGKHKVIAERIVSEGLFNHGLLLALRDAVTVLRGAAGIALTRVFGSVAARCLSWPALVIQ